MVFFVGDRYKKQFHVLDVEVNDWSDPQAFWIFEFANLDTDQIQASTIVPHPTKPGTLATFTIPSNFLIGDRAGPLTHQFKMRDGSTGSVLHDVIYRDELRVAHKES